MVRASGLRISFLNVVGKKSFYPLAVGGGGGEGGAASMGKEC